MNLSCENCKTIQSFSGDPPKCDVCGWVCDASTTTDTPYWQNLRNLCRQPVGQQIKKDIKKGIEGFGGCLFGLLYLTFAAAVLLVFVAVVMWAWHVVFG